MAASSGGSDIPGGIVSGKSEILESNHDSRVTAKSSNIDRALVDGSRL